MSASDISAGLGGTNDPNQRTCPRSDAPDNIGATDASRHNQNGALDARSYNGAPVASGEHGARTSVFDGNGPGHGHCSSSSPITRRPLTGERAEPVARRMRTNGPPQQEEPTTASNTRWGLGPCDANDRWNICDQYIRDNDGRGTRDGLGRALTLGGCPDNVAEMTIQTWLQAGLLIHSGGHIRAGAVAVDVHGNLRALQPLVGQEERPPAGTNLVALLPLFDGTGLARIAVDEAIQDCGDLMLVRFVFVEHDRTLARQVAAVWSNEVHSGRASVAHTPIACDI